MLIRPISSNQSQARKNINFRIEFDFVAAYSASDQNSLHNNFMLLSTEFHKFEIYSTSKSASQ